MEELQFRTKLVSKDGKHAPPQHIPSLQTEERAYQEPTINNIPYICRENIPSDGSDIALNYRKNMLDYDRPSSAILRARRKEQEQKEYQLRGLINTVSSSYSADDHSVSSNHTFNTVETSLLSHGRNLSKGSNIKWETVNVYITFGLLTLSDQAPMMQGIHGTQETLMQGTTILTSILGTMKTLSKAMIEQNTGNILMKCQDPFVTSVQRDGEFHRL